jgi:subtilisin family serine protease
MRQPFGMLGLWAGLAAGCCAGFVAGRAQAAAAEAGDRHVLVMAADPSINRPDLRGARGGAYRASRRYPGVPSEIVHSMKRLAEDYKLEHVDHWPMRSLGVHCVVFAASPEAQIDALVTQLAADGRVESAQAMNWFELQGAIVATRGDPHRVLQRSHDVLGIAEAHRWTTGRGVRVAVVDTGVAAAHPDLSGQVTARKNFAAGEAQDDRHGTAIAGVIGAKAGNGIGIVGIAPGARLLALRACEERESGGRGSCSTFDLARAIDFAIVAEADVLNLSLGGPRDRLLERLLEQAIERRIVVVAAAGEGDAAFPSGMTGVIAVSGEGLRPEVAALFAPGTDGLSLVPPDGYDFFSGSSIAAAQVTGIVALLRERAPGLSAAGARRALAATAAAPTSGDAVQRVVHACAALAEVGSGIDCGDSLEAH